MSAVRYGLTMLAGAGTTYDPLQKQRELVQVTFASASVRKSVALVPISLGLTGSSPAVAAGFVPATATFTESATGAIIIFQGSMRTSAQNTKACIGQNAGCMYSSSFHCNARQAKVFHIRQMIVLDFAFYSDIAVRGSGA